MSSLRIGLATAARLDEPDPDETLLLEALARQGAVAELVPWDADEGGKLDLLVVRSTWNYPEYVTQFLGWLESRAKTTRLLNPPELLRANIDKRYLAELEGRGIAIVPTAFVSRNDARSLREVLAPLGWDDVVVKPRISAGSFRTKRVTPNRLAEGEEFFRQLVDERDVLVQPYLSAVETVGERSLIFIDGEFRHAVKKHPRFFGDEEAVLVVPIAEDERAFAERVIEPIRARILYARVDVTRGPAGEICLMELELVEPSLFLAQHPGSAELFAEAIVREALDPKIVEQVPSGR